MATTAWVAGNSELSLGPGNLYVAPTNTAQDDWSTASYTALGGCSSAVLRDVRSYTDLVEAQKGTSWADRVLTGSNSEIEYSLTRPYVERIELVDPDFYVDYATDGVTVKQVSHHRAIGRRLSANKVWVLFKAFNPDGVESTNKLEWRYMLAAFYSETLELTFDASTQRTYPIMAAAFECSDVVNASGQPALWWSGVA
jgi:hypothetical protein